MKNPKRIILLFTAALIAALVALPSSQFFASSGTVSAALTPAQVSTKANDYCTKGDTAAVPESRQACIDGFVWGYNNIPLDQGCNKPQSQGGYQSSNPLDSQLSACHAGNTGGIKLRQSDSSTSTTTTTPVPSFVCTGLKDTGRSKPLTYCKQGYNGGKSGNNKSDVCQVTNGTELKACQDAYEIGKVTQCVSATKMTDFKACQDGVKGKQAGKSKDETCGKKSGSQKTLCELGFSKAAAPVADASAPTEDQQLTCDAKFDNPLTWVICPVVNVLSELVEQLDNFITSQLTIETDTIFCNSASGANDNCNNYYTAWQSFRNIALGLLIIAGLVVVISQALGMEILDAYTIRKILPRILVAAIFITLSWPLMKLAVQFTNDLGFGVRRLIYAPFSDLQNSLNLGFGGIIGNIFGGTAAVAGGTVATIAVWIPLGGIGVMLSYLATGALAVMVAFFVLVLRQVGITLLILIAPLAIVMYVLPNTHKYYKIWWESFSKALLMFPLIAAFIATGRVFSAISISTGGPIYQLVGFLAYFAPYFIIPLTFRFAGGFIRTLGGFVNDRSRGGFDRLKKYRANSSKNRIARARTKGLYRPELGSFDKTIKGRRYKNSVGNLLNKVGSYTSDADEMIPYKLGQMGTPGFKRGYERDKARIQAAEHEQTMKAMQHINPGYKGGRLMGGLVKGSEHDYTKHLSAPALRQLNDNFALRDDQGNIRRHALTDKEKEDGMTEGRIVGYRAPEGLSERVQMADLIGTSTDNEARDAAAQLRAAAPKMEEYAMSAETNRVNGKFLGLAAAAREGRLGLDDIVANHNELLHHGEAEEAVNQTNTLQELATQKRTEMARGHGIGFREDGTAYNVYAWDGKEGGDSQSGALSDKAQTSAARMSTQDLMGKSETIDAMEETFFAGASEYEMEYNTDQKSEDFGKVQYKYERNPDGSVMKNTETGEPIKIKKAVGSVEAQRAPEFQGRLKNLATYNSGDSDVGRKIKRLWVDKLGRPESELVWGGGTPDQIEMQQATGGNPQLQPKSGNPLDQGPQGPQSS